MKFYDLTIPLSPTIPEWPGDQKFIRQEKKGSGIVSKLTLSSHFGTHIDAPKHFLFNKPGVDKTPLESLIGIYHVYALKSNTLITRKDLESLPITKGQRVLFKTTNSALLGKKQFTSNYISLSLEAAEYLVKKQVLLVGVDYFGIEAKGSPGHPVHKALLKAGIVIVEGLNLNDIKPGNYDGAILPLNIKNSDGAPARAVLWRH